MKRSLTSSWLVLLSGFVSVRFMYMLLCVHFLSLSSCLSILVFPWVFVFERDTLDRSCPTVKGLEEILLGMFLKKIKADFSLCLSLNSGEMFWHQDWNLISATPIQVFLLIFSFLNKEIEYGECFFVLCWDLEDLKCFPNATYYCDWFSILVNVVFHLEL